MKKQQRQLTNDEVRQKILEFLLSVRKKARSLVSVSATITEIKRGLKPSGISQNEVVTNLDFLVQHGWVIEEVEKRTFKSPRGFEFPSGKRKYKLSELGINHFEGASMFSKMSRFAGINIQNIHGIIILGDHNIVRTEFIDIFKKLEQLENGMKMSSSITEEQKLITQADIQTIKDQLSKPVPDKNIIRRAMEGIFFLGSIPGLIELYQMVKVAIEGFLK